MRLTIFNGSPRARVSNTRILTDAFREGFSAAGGGPVETYYITGSASTETLVRAAAESDCVMLAFPLYVDSMPSGVKAFIEALEPLKGQMEGVRFCFLVQSGFSEAVHSRGVERYLKRLTGKLGGTYLGTIIRGGANAIRDAQGNSKERALAPLRQLGESLARFGEMDADALSRLARPERLSAFMVFLLNVLDRTGILGLIWRKDFRENGTYDRRYDRPFLQERSSGKSSTSNLK